METIGKKYYFKIDEDFESIEYNSLWECVDELKNVVENKSSHYQILIKLKIPKEN